MIRRQFIVGSSAMCTSILTTFPFTSLLASSLALSHEQQSLINDSIELFLHEEMLGKLSESTLRDGLLQPVKLLDREERDSLRFLNSSNQEITIWRDEEGYIQLKFYAIPQ